MASVFAGKALPTAEVVAKGGVTNATITEEVADWCCPLNVSIVTQIVDNLLFVFSSKEMNIFAVPKLLVSKLGELVLYFRRTVLVCCVIHITNQ